MSGTDLKQRLVAILAADVAGYSRLMASDERATVAALDAARAVFRNQIETNQGRVIDMAGDSVLAVFETATGAVSASLAIQREINLPGENSAEDRRMRFRIGVHLGDVIEKADGTIYGDGVNIAARLEGLAEPGGITVSDSIRNAVKGKIGASFEDQGEQKVKNIAEPVRAYRVRAEGAGAVEFSPPAKPTPAVGDGELSLPDKPSIAVLPFANLSGDPEQEYFTDGITEDIITELSRFHSLFVIARNSTFTYKGKAVDVRTVAKELGVRYVLEGSIRRAANRIRVTAQLVDAATGNHIWAEKYDRVLEDIFAVQEELTRSIVAAIAPQIESVELTRAARRRPDSLSAYEIALRANADALAAWAKPDVAQLDRAIRGAQAALAIDPRSVLANIVIARSNYQRVLHHAAPDLKGAWREGMHAADRVVELDRYDHGGYIFRGVLLTLLTDAGGGPHEALNNCRHAHELNPNDALALLALGWTEAIHGYPEQGIEHLLKVLRANPRDPWVGSVQGVLAYAFFLAKQYAHGLERGLLALSQASNLPDPHQNVALCHVGLGEIGKAKTAFEKFRRLAPEYAEGILKGSSILRRPEDRHRHLVFLRIAAGLEDPSAAEALR